METEKDPEQLDPEVAVENAGDVADIPIELEVTTVKPEIIKLDQSFYFIAEPDQTTKRYTLSIPYDSIKNILGSGLLTAQSKIVKFSIPL